MDRTFVITAIKAGAIKAAVITALLAPFGAVQAATQAGGWILAGGAPKAYEIGEDDSETVSGKPSRYVRYVAGDASRFGTLMQQISAKNYRGMRVRFQAMVKTRDASGWAGLWMRVDSPGMPNAAFYNSQDKPTTGSSDWQLRSVTLDVPEDADVLSFGVIEEGKGQVWIDQLSLEAVGQDVPVDRQPAPPSLPAAPAL